SAASPRWACRSHRPRGGSVAPRTPLTPAAAPAYSGRKFPQQYWMFRNMQHPPDDNDTRDGAVGRDIRGPVDASVVPRFAGIATFARLPRLDEVGRADVAVAGVPFDSGVSYRPGARFGPA